MKHNPLNLSVDNQITPQPKKATYRCPVLRAYGSVNKLTTGSAGSITDGNGMPHTMSDRSTKQNIVCIGKHPCDIGLYLFDYKPEYRDACGHGKQFGVMADEVERVIPEAVFIHPNGYKMVNYAMLGISRNLH